MQINLQSPFQGRKWLSLIEEDAACGWRLKRNLDVPRDFLGFSCNSNHLGLRGPSNEHAENVIFGTSYAMGIAVNNGENWYERCLNQNEWLNLGIATGIREWRELAEQHHKGRKETALLLYHPNIWVHCQMYERWRQSGTSVFQALRWKTGWLECAALLMRQKLRRIRDVKSGNFVYLPYQNKVYHLDFKYAQIDMKNGESLVRRHLDYLVELLRPFKHKVIIRIPVKQQLVFEKLRTAKACKLQQNYDEAWQWVVASLGTLPNTLTLTPGEFSLVHYHAYDSHWNALGNHTFSEQVKELLLAVQGNAAKNRLINI